MSPQRASYNNKDLRLTNHSADSGDNPTVSGHVTVIIPTVKADAVDPQHVTCESLSSTDTINRLRTTPTTTPNHTHPHQPTLTVRDGDRDGGNIDSTRISSATTARQNVDGDSDYDEFEDDDFEDE